MIYLLPLWISKHHSEDSGIIVDVLPASTVIGTMERARLVWLYVCNLPDCVRDSAGSGRYMIPLDRLRWLWKVAPYNHDRILDVEDDYQPFLNVVIDAWGLIYDREAKAYLCV